jgi:glycosyltransferase involved in cell wall biosynthesis
MMVKKKKIHIVGTHGVPAKYGGFETLADYLCQNLSAEYDITVYCNAHKYPQREQEYFGAKLMYLKIEANGFKGIFYDLFTYFKAILSADIILYLSPVGSGFMTPLKYLTRRKVIVNHGGLNEWEREKLSSYQKIWAKFNHFVAAKFADVNIADNYLYQKSLKSNFNVDSVVIRYGGDHVNKDFSNTELLENKYPFVKSTKYAVSVSRAQLDNNIHMVLEAFEDFTDFKIVLISNWNVSKYGLDLKSKYKNNPNIIILDAIYDKLELDYIRGNAYVYIHSHSRCGTAPSLVEAMHLEIPILSLDADTNRETTKNKAVYFSTSSELNKSLCSLDEDLLLNNKQNMHEIAKREYTWAEISKDYSMLFKSL